MARDEFGSFHVEEDHLHIVISVKDFRAIIQHASILGADICANYSMPARPMQLRYDGDGIKCEFLLMTVGERGTPGQKGRKTRTNAKGAAGPQLEETATRANSHAPAPVPPTAPKTSQSRPNPMPSLRPPIERPSQRPPPATLESESLFVPQDNDEQWEPVNVDEDDEEENGRLGWDTSVNPVSNVFIRVVHTELGEATDYFVESVWDEHADRDGQSTEWPPAKHRRWVQPRPHTIRADTASFSSS